jgi:hypothetical protein
MLRALVFTALLLVIATSAFAQPFYATWSYRPENGAALTTACNGATPIPDTWVVKIYWDVDSDGPDLTDPMPTICDVPPECETGPNGTINFNQFAMNGVSIFGVAGYFETEWVFLSAAILPDPPRYYLRIYDPGSGNFLWTSTVKTLTSGLQEVNTVRADWTCGTGGPQCMVRDEHE